MRPRWRATFGLGILMAVSTGVFSVDIGAIGTTYSVTGLPFTPQFGKFWWTLRVDTADAASEKDVNVGIGYAVSASKRACAVIQSDHAATTSATDRSLRDDACIATLTIAGAVAGLADFDAWLADGFRVIIDDAFPALLRVNYWVTDDEGDLLTFTSPASAGDQDITGFAFQPALVEFLGTRGSVAGPPDDRASAVLIYGAARSASEMGALCISSGDAQGTAADCYKYCTDEKCIVNFSEVNGVVDEHATFVQWLADGVRLNWGNTQQFGYIAAALRGATNSYKMGSLLTVTDTTTDITGPTVGSSPTSVFVVSHGAAENTDLGTGSAHLSISLGAGTGTGNRHAQAAQDKDAAGTQDCICAIEHDEIYIHFSTAATQAVDGLMNIFTWADPIVFRMDDADPAQSFAWVIVTGDVPAEKRAGGGRAGRRAPLSRPLSRAVYAA